MRNWEQVLTVPPATSDWTVTQIFSKQNWKNEKKIRQITTGKKREKIENKTANISNYQNTKSASNTTATIFIKADFLNIAEYFVGTFTAKKNTVLEKKITANLLPNITTFRFCRWDLDLDESVNNSSNKSWYQVSKIKEFIFIIKLSKI